MARTTLNPNQIDTTQLTPDEAESLNGQPKVIDPFRNVDLFGETSNGTKTIKSEGIADLFTAAEKATVGLNTIHAAIHEPDAQEAITNLAERTVDPKTPESRLLVLVNLIHQILHELDSTKNVTKS